MSTGATDSVGFKMKCMLHGHWKIFDSTQHVIVVLCIFIIIDIVIASTISLYQ